MREAEAKLAAEVAAWFARAAAADAEEDRAHGPDQRGDEMPEWVANKQARLERIRAAKAALEAEAEAEPLDSVAEGLGRWARRHPWEAAATAFVIGIVLGKRR